MTLPVMKTVKLFIDGQFPRTESGRSFKLNKKDGEIFANCCLSSRKDFRNSVVAAQKALAGWSSKTAFNRAQILYRMAEMTQSKAESFEENISLVYGLSDKEAKAEVEKAIDHLVYFAGFADKYQHLVSTVNPVSGPFHNFSKAEPVGVVAMLFRDPLSFSDFVEQVASCLCSGNTIVAFLGHQGASFLAEFAEVIATSDVPGGVINLLSGEQKEVAEHMAAHMEVQSFYCDDEDLLNGLRPLAIDNMKRIVGTAPEDQLQKILKYTETKTVWHPNGY